MGSKPFLDRWTSIDDLLRELIDTGLSPRILVRHVPNEQADFALKNVRLDKQSNGTYAIPGDDPDREGAAADVGGADYCSFAFASIDGQPFSVWFDWLDQSGARIISTGPRDVEGRATVVEPDFRGRYISFSQDTQSDYVRIRVVDESGEGTQNRVSGTVNFK